MATKQDVINRFLYMFPDCDISDALFDESYFLLLDELEARNGTVSILLTSGTKQYDLPANIVKVWEAYYQMSADASGWTLLQPTSLQQLAAYDSGWRAWNITSTPMEYYITTAVNGNSSKDQIGFHPTPNTTSSGGYPAVILYCTVHADLLVGDTVPPAITDPYLIAYRMAYQWAKLKRPDAAAFYENSYSKELQDEKARQKSKQFTNEGIFIRPGYTFTRGV